jgi:hypothetical protein
MVRDNNIEWIRQRLPRLSDIDSIKMEEMTLLMEASRCGLLEMCQELILCGVNIHEQNCHGITALHIAAMESHLSVLYRLIIVGGDPLIQSAAGNTCLHLLVAKAHCERRDPYRYISIIALILKKCPLIVNIQNERGETPLHLSCLFHSSQSLVLLTKLGNIDYSLLTNDGDDYLLCALHRYSVARAPHFTTDSSTTSFAMIESTLTSSFSSISSLSSSSHGSSLSFSSPTYCTTEHIHFVRYLLSLPTRWKIKRAIEFAEMNNLDELILLLTKYGQQKNFVSSSSLLHSGYLVCEMHERMHENTKIESTTSYACALQVNCCDQNQMGRLFVFSDQIGFCPANEETIVYLRKSEIFYVEKGITLRHDSAISFITKNQIFIFTSFLHIDEVFKVLSEFCRKPTSSPSVNLSDSLSGSFSGSFSIPSSRLHPSSAAITSSNNSARGISSDSSIVSFRFQSALQSLRTQKTNYTYYGFTRNDERDVEDEIEPEKLMEKVVKEKEEEKEKKKDSNYNILSLHISSLRPSLSPPRSMLPSRHRASPHNDSSSLPVLSPKRRSLKFRPLSPPTNSTNSSLLQSTLSQRHSVNLDSKLPTQQFVSYTYETRPSLWFEKSGGAAKKSLAPSDYWRKLYYRTSSSIISEKNESAWESIEKDIERTLPGHPLFDRYFEAPSPNTRKEDEKHHHRSKSPSEVEKEPESILADIPIGSIALRHLLRAYALRDPILGYSQSMNCIASVLLIVFNGDLEMSFWTLCGIVENILNQYYSDFSILVEDANLFDILLKLEIPILCEYWKEFGIDWGGVLQPSTIYRWFHTLFSHSSAAPPFTTLLWIWDNLITSGPQILFEVGLSILKLSSEQLRKFEEAEDALHCILSFSLSVSRSELSNTVAETRNSLQGKKLFVNDLRFTSILSHFPTFIQSLNNIGTPLHTQFINPTTLSSLFQKYGTLSHKRVSPTIDLKDFQQIMILIQLEAKPNSEVPSLNPNTLSKVFSLIDVDGDWRITFLEFIAGLFLLIFRSLSLSEHIYFIYKTISTYRELDDIVFEEFIHAAASIIHSSGQYKSTKIVPNSDSQLTFEQFYLRLHSEYFLMVNFCLRTETLMSCNFPQMPILSEINSNLTTK